MRINLKVSFAEKDKVKAMGAKWDWVLKTWFIDSKFIQDLEVFSKWFLSDEENNRFKKIQAEINNEKETKRNSFKKHPGTFKQSTDGKTIFVSDIIHLNNSKQDVNLPF